MSAKQRNSNETAHSPSSHRPGFRTPELPPPPKTELAENVLTAASIVLLNNTLKAFLTESSPSQPEPISRFLGFFSDSEIPVACGGKYDAAVTGQATRFELDYPFGETAYEVSKKAYDRALQAAKDNAKDKLDAIAKRIQCDSDCFVIRAPPEPTFDLVDGTVDAHYSELGLAVQYNWTFKLRAKQTFKCVRTTPAG
jgi:hypothetical protein